MDGDGLKGKGGGGGKGNDLISKLFGNDATIISGDSGGGDMFNNLFGGGGVLKRGVVSRV